MTLPDLLLKTDKKLLSFHIFTSKVAAIVTNIDPSKATGPDGTVLVEKDLICHTVY